MWTGGATDVYKKAIWSPIFCHSSTTSHSNLPLQYIMPSSTASQNNATIYVDSTFGKVPVGFAPNKAFSINFSRNGEVRVEWDQGRSYFSGSSSLSCKSAGGKETDVVRQGTESKITCRTDETGQLEYLKKKDRMWKPLQKRAGEDDDDE